MIDGIVQKGLDQIPIEGIKRLKKYIENGNKLVLNGTFYDDFGNL